MYFPALALGFVFVAVGLPFIGKAKTETDPIQKRNKKLVGVLFLLAGAAFFIAFGVGAVNR